jgi:DNA-binding LacI/PurR family transcriptional regulator
VLPRDTVTSVTSTSVRPTIFQVAEEAGVSITTVSHVFSGKRKVHEETRRRVLETAERLAYKPRATAQALATGRSMTLGLQITLSGHELVLNPYFASLLPAMSLAAIELGYSFLFVPPNPDRDAFVDPLLAGARIDGGIVIDPMDRDPFVSALLAGGTPFTSIGRLLDTPHENWVDNDHDAASAHVLEHLAERGYESPVLLTIPTRVSYVTDYSTAFAGRSTAGADGIVVAEDLSEQAAVEAIKPLLGSADPPDAVFCIHDQLAIGVLRAASELGVCVPDELGVVGVTDSLIAAHARPPLTSVRVHAEQAGRLVVQLLDQLLRGEADISAPRIVPTRLVSRESTARS